MIQLAKKIYFTQTRTGAALPLVVLFIVFMFLMNGALLDYREDEIMYNLNIVSHELGDYKSLGLLGRYRLIGKRLSSGREGKDDLIEEARMQGMLRSLTSGMEKETVRPLLKSRPLSLIVKYYIAGISFLQGKRPPEEIHLALNNPYLELSYFYERHRRWDRALQTMRMMLERTQDPPEQAYRYLLLHSGFCAAMLSRHDDAVSAYDYLIDAYPDSEEAATARKLLDILYAVDRGISRILQSASPADVKGERLFLLSSYSRALREFNEYFRTGTPGHPAFYRSLYFRGRSYEELGDDKNAVRDFTRILSEQPHSRWAAMANRRMFIMGSAYAGGAALAEAAETKSARYNDRDFFASLTAVRQKSNPDTITMDAAEARFRELSGGAAHRPATIRTRSVADTRPSAEAKTAVDRKGAGEFSLEVNRQVSAWYGDISEQREKYANIVTSAGFRFSGKVVREDEKEIVLETEFGMIPVKVSTIRSITRTNR